MPRTYGQLVAAARARVPSISVRDAHQALQSDGRTLVIDVRDPGQTVTTGLIPSALHISLGTLPLRADREVPESLRAAELADRARPIITTCEVGSHAALGAWLLQELGFTEVHAMEGGMQAWVAAGLSTVGRLDDG